MARLSAFVWAARLDQPDAAAYHQRSLAYKLKGKLDLALASLNEAIRLKPKQAAEPLCDRGDIYLHLGDSAKAAADFHEALRVKPSHVRAKHSLAALVESRQSAVACTAKGDGFLAR